MFVDAWLPRLIVADVVGSTSTFNSLPSLIEAIGTWDAH